ncbi:hypothetical protein IQ13_3296 [Lacibacter cauensis]|uniref:Uncharacterized protein n=1 Tax=Lacibacter cauensis TaxID=510947 RepID=A0A562SH62_9BACT|nr:hypothetical protein [Lacibacter cauensis]TWI80617.1 hypothetical protein IQ13_3296 [Lacibacter cauensis]
METLLSIEILRRIKADPKYYADRTSFHHNYELLERFWRERYENKDNAFSLFIREFGADLWQIRGIQKLATQFASIECVGSSNYDDFTQTQDLAKATMYLRYFSLLFKKNSPKCSEIGCRHFKQGLGYCTKANGRKWTKKDHPYSSFNALMVIIRQVRNNLFHGSKFSIESTQYLRDKKLITLSARTTQIIIDNLSKIVWKHYR